MTQALDQKALATALSPCPLCGEHLQLAIDPRMKGMLEHPASGCPISACCFLDTPDLRAAWNRRASFPTPEPVAWAELPDVKLARRGMVFLALELPESVHTHSMALIEAAFVAIAASTSPPSHQGLRELPVELTPAMKRVLASAAKYGTEANGELWPAKLWAELLDAALQSQPAPSGETK